MRPVYLKILTFSKSPSFDQQTCNIHKKNSQIILITDLKQKKYLLAKKRILDCFCKNRHFLKRKKVLTFIFFAEKSKNHEK